MTSENTRLPEPVIPQTAEEPQPPPSSAADPPRPDVKEIQYPSHWGTRVD